MISSVQAYICSPANLPEAKNDNWGDPNRNERSDSKSKTPLPQTLVRIPIETKQENSQDDAL